MAPILDSDDDNLLGALTDGLLVLRFFFGFTGTTLTSEALGEGGMSRCSAGAIANYLAGLI